jgi:uncharacterized spore protein YtfJ
MKISYDDALREAEEAASNPLENFIQNLAGRVGTTARAEAVFAEPVERDGVTVVPVAKVRWGFGGGAGSDGNDGDSGAGGGGGMTASPLGYIEVTDRGAEFVRIKDPASYWPALVAGGLGFWLVMRGLRSLFR